MAEAYNTVNVPVPGSARFQQDTAMAIGRLKAALGPSSSPTFAGLLVGSDSISATLIGQWNTAYGWGDHADAGYLTSETDPVFGASPAAGIDADDITNWNTAYSGNHAAVTLNGLTGITLAGQELSLTGGYVIPTTTQETHWDAAYSASHARQHSITGTDDHTSAATAGQLLKADANGLPVDATNTDVAVAAAVAASHVAVTIPGSSNGLSLTGQEISLPTTATPEVARLGLGIAPDATAVLYAKSTSYPLVREERDAGSSTTGSWSTHDFTLVTSSTPTAENMNVAILFNIYSARGNLNLARIVCYQGTGDGQYGKVAIRTANGSNPSSSGSDRIVIMPNGKTGIGVSTPNESLEVGGKIRANTAFNLNGTDGLTSQVVALAKLTSGGADGSITITGGIVTAYTAPT